MTIRKIIYKIRTKCSDINLWAATRLSFCGHFQWVAIFFDLIFAVIILFVGLSPTIAVNKLQLRFHFSNIVAVGLLGIGAYLWCCVSWVAKEFGIVNQFAHEHSMCVYFISVSAPIAGAWLLFGAPSFYVYDETYKKAPKVGDEAKVDLYGTRKTILVAAVAPLFALLVTYLITRGGLTLLHNGRIPENHFFVWNYWDWNFHTYFSFLFGSGIEATHETVYCIFVNYGHVLLCVLAFETIIAVFLSIANLGEDNFLEADNKIVWTEAAKRRIPLKKR